MQIPICGVIRVFCVFSIAASALPVSAEEASARRIEEVMVYGASVSSD